jgi:hypothetical protein
MTEPTMRSDTKQLTGAKTDLSTLLGTWVNAKPGTDYLTSVVLTERDGVLRIHPYGSAATDATEPVDWGENVATTYVAGGTSDLAGFHASYELGVVRTELAGNEKLGILVIQSYTSIHDDTGRPSHYSREFFHRQPPAAPDLAAVGPAAVGPAAVELAPAGHGAGGIGSLLGDWINANPDTDWIGGFTLTDQDGRVILHPSGTTEPGDWGPAEVTTYQDNIGEPAFYVVYDLGAVEAVLAANTNKGLIIIAAFLRFKADADQRENFLCREFYYRRG